MSSPAQPTPNYFEVSIAALVQGVTGEALARMICVDFQRFSADLKKKKPKAGGDELYLAMQEQAVLYYKSYTSNLQPRMLGELDRLSNAAAKAQQETRKSTVLDKKSAEESACRQVKRLLYFAAELNMRDQILATYNVLLTRDPLLGRFGTHIQALEDAQPTEVSGALDIFFKDTLSAMKAEHKQSDFLERIKHFFLERLGIRRSGDFQGGVKKAMRARTQILGSPEDPGPSQGMRFKPGG